jgi:hypothetical protein
MSDARLHRKTGVPPPEYYHSLTVDDNCQQAGGEKEYRIE